MRTLAAQGITLVLVTHHIEEVIPEIERVVLLRGGRIAADGTRAELLRDGPLSEVFGGPIDRADQRDVLVHGEVLGMQEMRFVQRNAHAGTQQFVVVRLLRPGGEVLVVAGRQDQLHLHPRQRGDAQRTQRGLVGDEVRRDQHDAAACQVDRSRPGLPS